ncbi:DIP5 [Candida pseudojiufengensis]|uniref:DIP5 n=1 Tax=Candida pseudojiufengensis TaxID=497109 RepID=UPI002225A7CD|nr:DIP5 [Candida pseudojiufengensis]KAI5960308.1 DIP5 [Candida pseudojiufengensis]
MVFENPSTSTTSNEEDDEKKIKFVTNHNNKSNNDIKSIVSKQHEEEYDLYVAKSNPSIHLQNIEDGHRLRKALDPRHVSTGSSLRTAGPAAILITYSVIGAVVYIVMTALGEISTFIPMPGFANYGKRYCDEALGFACGYNYLIKYLILPANQMTAGALTIQYWIDRETVNPGIWITIFLIIIMGINFLGVRFFGEIEFWLSSVKVLTVLGIILILIIIVLGGGPTGDRLGFRYWENPGAFIEYENLSNNFIIEGDKGRFVSFIAVLVSAVFAYLGTELVAITFAETRNPRKAIPKAIKLTLYRILVFYILSILFVGMAVSSRDSNLMGASGTNAGASPFVIAIKNAQINGLDHVINACILIFVFSAANSDVYVCSRALYSLAADGYAPKIFTKTNRLGVPYYGLGLSLLFSLLAYMNVSSGSAEVFGYFVNVVSLTGLIAWSCILIFHISFMKALKVQGFDRNKDLVYKSPFQPYASYIALSICILVILIKNFTVFLGDEFDYENFITGYIILPVFFIIFLGYKFWYKTKWLKSNEVDLDTFRDVIDSEYEQFKAEDAERKAVREAEGKKYDKEWFYDKFLGWIF